MRHGRHEFPKKIAAMSSWVESAANSDFPIQNLPFGIFAHAASRKDARVGVAIGALVLDVRALALTGFLTEGGFDGAAIFSGDTLNAFMGCERSRWQWVRSKLTSLFAVGGDALLRESAELRTECLVPMAEVTMLLPAKVPLRSLVERGPKDQVFDGRRLTN